MSSRYPSFRVESIIDQTIVLEALRSRPTEHERHYEKACAERMIARLQAITEGWSSEKSVYVQAPAARKPVATARRRRAKGPVLVQEAAVQGRIGKPKAEECECGEPLAPGRKAPCEGCEAIERQRYGQTGRRRV